MIVSLSPSIVVFVHSISGSSNSREEEDDEEDEEEEEEGETIEEREEGAGEEGEEEEGEEKGEEEGVEGAEDDGDIVVGVIDTHPPCPSSSPPLSLLARIGGTLGNTFIVNPYLLDHDLISLLCGG